MSSTAIVSFDPAPRPAAIDPPPGASTSPLPLISPDAAGIVPPQAARTAAHLADIVAHARAGTPFLLALYGPAGSGKSTLLDRVLGAVAGFGLRANADRTASILPGIVTARIDVGPGADPAQAIMAGVFAALAGRAPRLAEEAAAAGGDPVKAARRAGDQVNTLRRSLDQERQSLDELSGRRARLVDSVLFEAGGSRVDAYARAHRVSIEARLRTFGLGSANPLQTYKELVREVGEGGAGASRLGASLRALWVYRGQGTLIIFAVLLMILGLLCGSLADNPTGLNAWVDGLGDRYAWLSAWTHGHEGWLEPIARAIMGVAVVSLLVAVARAWLFVQPIFKGASLLSGDLEGRRRDLDSLVAHQTRRVDHLIEEVETAVRIAEAADRRAEARRAAGRIDPGSPPTVGEPAPDPSAGRQAEAFFAGLSAGMASPAATRSAPAANDEGEAVPSRIVVAIDGLDQLPAAAAAEFLEVGHRLLARPHFVTIVAVQRGHLAAGFSETDPALAASKIDRCVQLSYDLGAESFAPGLLAGRLLDAGAPIAAPDHAGDAQSAGLDRPWQAYETELVTALAAFAGSTPRSVKRFVNTYRVARADPRLDAATPAEFGGLALGLALDGSGVGAELTGLEAEAEDGQPQAQSQGELARALAAARQASGRAFTPAEARLGLQVARSYGRRG